MQQKQKAVIYLSDTRSVYIGKLEPTYTRFYVTATLIVALEDQLEVVLGTSGETLLCKSVLIPAGAKLSVKTTGNKVVICSLDDLGSDYAKLSLKMRTAIRADSGEQLLFNLKHENEVIEQATYLSAVRPSTSEAFELLEIWIGSPAQANPVVIDERVISAIRIIKENYNKNISVTDIAQQVSLSVPRLIQLFKQATGSPIRRYRLWHRLWVTCNLVLTGKALTEAAVAAGFSDYAQFSRVYRELCGGSPSVARKNTDVRIHKIARIKLLISIKTVA
ncbi:MAG: helix-turn-helix transcriptional regulator [Hahellaceae bacterium]|nr:helix-turn-helix transcriptional regulator [Hahellaceae bacterium]